MLNLDDENFAQLLKEAVKEAVLNGKVQRVLIWQADLPDELEDEDEQTNNLHQVQETKEA